MTTATVVHAHAVAAAMCSEVHERGRLGRLAGPEGTVCSINRPKAGRSWGIDAFRPPLCRSDLTDMERPL